MAEDEQRTRGRTFEQTPHSFRNQGEREHGVANLRFVAGDDSPEQVTWNALVECRLGPSAVRVVAGNRDQYDPHALSQVLAEARAVQRVKEELIPIRRSAVNDRERWQTRLGRVRGELQAGDVPVETVMRVPKDVPCRAVPQVGRRRLRQLHRVERAARRGVGDCLHRAAGVWQVPAEGFECLSGQRCVREILRQQCVDLWIRQAGGEEEDTGDRHGEPLSINSHGQRSIAEQPVYAKLSRVFL